MAKEERPEKKRSDGEGTIFRRGNGWVAQVTVYDAHGKRRFISRSAATQNGARKELTELKGKHDSHRLVVTGKATLRAWLDEWLETRIKPNRAPRTYKGYHDLLAEHLPERIGAIRMSRCAQQPETFQRLFVSIADSGLGRSANLLRAVLRSALNKAVKSKRLDYNPILATDPINYKPIESSVFTAEQGQQFLKAAERERLGALFVLALSLGLRKGEVSGLKEQDLDFTARTVKVQRQLQWVKTPGQEQGGWIEGDPKRGAKRTLPMTETVYRFLVRHLAKRNAEALTAGEKWRDSGYLFVSTTGAPLHERDISEAFHLACDSADVPRIRFHDTRHTCGTLLHIQRASPFTIQTVLGHSQLSTTKRYTHVPVEATKPALASVATLLDPTAPAAPDFAVTNSVTNRPTAPETQAL